MGNMLMKLLGIKQRKELLTQEQIEKNVKEWIAGDQQAFLRLHHTIDSIINQVIYTKKYNGYFQHFEDLKQECWIDTIRILPNWDPTRGSLKNYLFKCYCNRILSYLHKKCQTQGYEDIEEMTDLLTTEDVRQLPSELEIKLYSRFDSAVDVYVIDKVCCSIYLRIFNLYRNQIIKEIREITGLKLKRVRFLIDYSIVLMRKKYINQLEDKCAEYLS